MDSSIYFIVDVDMGVQVLDHHPVDEEVLGFYDGRFFKFQDGILYASMYYNGEEDAGKERWEWVKVEGQE